VRQALITGAAGGIGQALCLAFRRAGYRVIASDLKQPAGDYDAYLSGDLASLVREPRSRADFLRELREGLGGDGLHALVNNAAVQVVKPAEALRVEDWHLSLDTNVVAPFLLIRELLPELRRARGSVVNISSVHARLTKPGFACYATSKAALNGLTRSLAVELGGQVRINAVNPAATATPMLREGFEGREQAFEELAGMHPVGRVAEPAEVARAALFLASDDASFMNGATLDVDGGIGARLHDPE
jgi:NAD(P)-dependent dehydrogenase (short-subunit alcohol dehydrogenase family)